MNRSLSQSLYFNGLWFTGFDYFDRVVCHQFSVSFEANERNYKIKWNKNNSAWASDMASRTIDLELHCNYLDWINWITRRLLKIIYDATSSRSLKCILTFVWMHGATIFDYTQWWFKFIQQIYVLFCLNSNMYSICVPYTMFPNHIVFPFSLVIWIIIIIINKSISQYMQTHIKEPNIFFFFCHAYKNLTQKLIKEINSVQNSYFDALVWVRVCSL